MSMIYQERLSESPLVENITWGWTASEGSSIRPAEMNWHMVFVRVIGHFYPLMVGPLTSSGVASWGGGAEILWIKFKLGTFMPNLPFKHYLNSETTLPLASGDSFWLHGSAWEPPTYENVEPFINRLVRQEVLMYNPLVRSILEGHSKDHYSPRTVRHHFLQATGLTQKHIQQAHRAQQAVSLLQKGVSILDTVYQTGYFDQPHLTRSLKKWIGHTPAQLQEMATA